MRKNRRIEKVNKCEWCGVTFHPWNTRPEAPYCSRSCAYAGSKGKRNKGCQKTVDKATYPKLMHTRGYVLVYQPKHPSANSHGYVLEHRIVVEDQIGRYLTRHENVHHLNGDKTDNRLENLELMTAAEHGRLESKRYWDARA